MLPHAWRRRPRQALVGNRRVRSKVRGDIWWELACRLVARAHSHVRGDIPTTRATRFAVLGPPPRAWGHLFVRHRQEDGDRSTPTCVGTSQGEDDGDAVLGVHPHVRGDIV